MTPKIGQTIETYGWYEGMTGVITNVQVGYTLENHGTVEVKVISMEPKSRLSHISVGDVEQFSYYNWEEAFRILP